MSSRQDSVRVSTRHQGPNPGVVAIIFTVVKLASIILVSALATRPSFPAPGTSISEMTAYFLEHPGVVLSCAFLQFGSAIPLGIFVAVVVSRLRFLGARAAGVDIAFFGGLLTAFDTLVSASVLWALVQTGVADNAQLVHVLYSLQFAFGGPGFSVPMGVFLAGVSVVAGVMKILPKWIVWPGIALAIIGELSWFTMIAPNLLFLIPLTRFPAFIWLIAAGFQLPHALASWVSEN